MCGRVVEPRGRGRTSGRSTTGGMGVVQDQRVRTGPKKDRSEVRQRPLTKMLLPLDCDMRSRSLSGADCEGYLLLQEKRLGSSEVLGRPGSGEWLRREK